MATNTLSGTARSFILRTYKNTGDAIVRYDEKTVAAEEVVYFSDVAAEVSYGDIFYFEFVSVDGSETDVWVEFKARLHAHRGAGKAYVRGKRVRYKRLCRR